MAKLFYMGKAYLTVKGASNLLGVTPEHIHRLCRDKTLRKLVLDDSITLINYDDVMEYKRSR